MSLKDRGPTSRRHYAVPVIVVGLGLWPLAAAGCHRGAPSASQDADVLPVVRVDGEGQLLTWIDDKGDFHVETRVADVPMMGRDTVRVVDPSRDSPLGESQVFVVDLRQVRADQTYPVRAMSRADFEAIAVARRQQTGPTLANAPPAGSAGGAPAPAAEAASARSASLGPVVIYGAEWCGACHDAARYLRRKGIAYVEKDIEKDPAAAREMQQKLAKNGLRGGSIPVIDVRGKVMVGFSAPDVEAALGKPL